MPISVTADAAAPGVPLHHHWNVCVGAGRANEGLRATWQEHLRTVVDACGFRYVRFHGLLHDDMFVYQERDGRAVYNFQYVDDLFDRLLDAGVRPFVEFGFAPSDLASEHGTVFWWQANGAPPKDLARWSALVEALVRHWADRYGLEEIRRWYYEVWNEPNLRPFFHGTRSDYFALYAATAAAVRAVDPALRVGGPATSNFVPDDRFAGETEDITRHASTVTAPDLDALDWQPVWLREFLDFCHRTGAPVDFVSVHPYPTDWALDDLGRSVRLTRSRDATRRDLALVRELVDAGPFPDAEIHLTEWSSSPSPRDHTHDYLQAATFVVKANVESTDLVDSLSYWTFTDVFEESGAGDSAFHGGFGMITYQGVPKPTFHAYRFLHRLGDERVAREPGAVVTRDSASGRLTVLAYHYPDEVRGTVPPSFDDPAQAQLTLSEGSPDLLRVTLTGLAAGTAFEIEYLDRDHGNAVGAWQAMGAPDPLDREQTRTLAAAAAATGRERAVAAEDGTLTLERTLTPWSVVLVSQV
ncbi:GH39 family glycosyl hydrolase [Streptomyces shenzhenensis]|uniref:GH39 family glycosyl hydrolase n=1 Tax=Streptomyces shenzhenensis TaxID=943815 RepID=UPI0015F11BDF|nr:beta-xylosidase [Streptomyces shenzhenensis]